MYCKVCRNFKCAELRANSFDTCFTHFCLKVFPPRRESSERLNCFSECQEGAPGVARSIGLCVMTSVIIMQCYHAVCYQVAESRNTHTHTHRKTRNILFAKRQLKLKTSVKEYQNTVTVVQYSGTEYHDFGSLSPHKNQLNISTFFSIKDIFLA
jgi:hypothetical protein